MELEMKKGFKQTEVGLIPEDWSIFSVEDVSTEMVQGINTAIDIPEYVESGVPMLKANNVIDGIINLNDSDSVSKRTYKKYTDRFKIKKYDFLFSNIGARLGTGALFLEEKEATYAWNIMRIRPDLKKVEPRFLSQFLNSNLFFKQIQASLTGSGMGFVPKNTLKNLLVTIPPTLAEQKAIATALSDVDDLISSLDALITKKKAIKQGAMQQLLKPPSKGGKRLDGFDGEWVKTSLGEICSNISSGKSDTDSITGVFPIYGSTGKIGIKNYFDYQGERILVARVGANAGTLYTVKGEYCVSDNTLIVELKNNISLIFIYYSLKLYDITQLIFGSGQPLVTGGQLKDIDMSIPSLKEQKAIAQILSDMDKELEELATKKEKYEHIKQGMMQELLTGKTRLV